MKKRQLSSAYNSNSEFTACGISFTYKRKRRGQGLILEEHHRSALVQCSTNSSDSRTPGPASFSQCVIILFSEYSVREKKRRVREKSGNLTGCLKKLLGCNLTISVSAKVLSKKPWKIL